jgi:predicted Zn-dependent protease
MAPVMSLPNAGDGQELAARLFGRDPLTADARLLRYVALVGRTVAGPARAGRYVFAVTESDLVYATAFPSGIVVVSRGLVFLVQSEAELAVTLSREMCRADSGGTRDFPGSASEGDPAREIELDACGARAASSAGYDAGAFLHFFGALEERATSVRGKSDLDARRERFRALPESSRGGKLLAERFRSSVIW